MKKGHAKAPSNHEQWAKSAHQERRQDVPLQIKEAFRSTNNKRIVKCQEISHYKVNLKN